MCAHHADAAKLQAFGEVENGATLDQRGEGGVRRQRRCVAGQRGRDPGRRDLAADDALAGIGLKPIDAGQLVRQPLPDRQQQARHDMDRAVGELGHLGELGLPGRGEAFAIGFHPMAFRHHLQRKAVMLHRPDQPHAPFDLAVVEHETRRRDLHGGAARPLVDQQNGARIGEPIERLIQRHGTIALALGDGEQPWSPRRCRDGCRSSRRSVTTKLSARSVSRPTS